MTADPLDDVELIETFLEPVRKCADYQPAFGQANRDGFDLRSFQDLYGADPFYAWLGLDDSLVYAAHKAGGGLSSVYRQIGVGSERLCRSILRGRLGLSDEQLFWSYDYEKEDGSYGTAILDARVAVGDLPGGDSERFEDWLRSTSTRLAGTSSGAPSLNGLVMEIRQGYKSADSKRQNADLRFGMRAYQADLLPAVVVMSTQVSEPVIRRYRSDGMLVLTGSLQGASWESTFTFFREVIGYDLAGFLQGNRERLRSGVTEVVKALLTPE